MNDFICPIDNPRLTSEYGMRKHPILKVNRLHAGVDFVSTILKNPTVFSSASGIVRIVKDEGNNGYGKHVIVTHSIRGIKYETVYAHLDSFCVKVGQKVKQGEKIGVLGNSGTSTSAHLHYEIHRGAYNYGNGTYPTSLNPLDFININKLSTTEGGNNMSITISSGHWKNTGSGASNVLNEVTENRRVVKRVAEILKQNKITVTEIHDNISNNVSSNLGYLVREHNKSKRELDVSVHFNASSGTQSIGIGTEVLYVNPNMKQKAKELSASIAVTGGFKNRGEKYRNNLGFLNGTTKPALLIEVCFVNSQEDAKLYNQNFEKICQTIAKELARFVGKTINTSPTPKPSNTTSKGDDDELKFSSSTLQKELDKLLGDNTSRKQIIDRAIKELKYNESWRTKKNIEDGDILSMALSLAIRDAKK